MDIMGTIIREFREGDESGILRIFNHYIQHTTNAFPDRQIPIQMFGVLKEMTKEYPFLVAVDSEKRVVGFGFLHPHNRISTFSSTAEITYFIDPEHRRRGIGSLLFEALVNAGRNKGIESILAAISSENLESLEFHRKLGFSEVGRFRGILRKNGKVLDVVWMQKIGLCK